MDSSTTTLCSGLFPITGCLVCFCCCNCFNKQEQLMDHFHGVSLALALSPLLVSTMLLRVSIFIRLSVECRESKHDILMSSQKSLLQKNCLKQTWNSFILQSCRLRNSNFWHTTAELSCMRLVSILWAETIKPSKWSVIDLSSIWPSSSKMLTYSYTALLLAHLSRRLMWGISIARLRRPSVGRPHFQTTSPLKPLGRLGSNFICSILGQGEQKFMFFMKIGFFIWSLWQPNVSIDL